MYVVIINYLPIGVVFSALSAGNGFSSAYSIDLITIWLRAVSF